MVYGRRRVPRSKRLAELRRETLMLRAGVVVLILLLLLCGLIFLSRIEFFRIKSISMEGNSVTSSSEIQGIIDDNINGYYFKMFPRKNFLIYPKGRIKIALMSEFKRIEEADLSINDFSELQVVVEEREPDVLWCGYERVAALSGDAEECYFIDSNGLIYSKAPNFSGNVFLRAYGEIGGLNPIGQKFLSVSKYKSLKFFQSAIERLGLTPEKLVKLSDGDMEMYFEKGGRLIYNFDQDMARLADDLGSILKDQDFRGGIDGGLGLDYIDLRLGNKVYYQFK